MSRQFLEDVCLTAFLILAWFVSGVTLMQGWGNYPTWLDMGPMMSNENFMRLRQAHYWLIYPLAVYPGIVSLALNVFLALLKPPGLSRPLLLGLLILSLVIAISTFAVQVPLQDQIDAKGFDPEVIKRLIETDMWARKIPGMIFMAGLVALTWQAIRRR